MLSGEWQASAFADCAEQGMRHNARASDPNNIRRGSMASSVAETTSRGAQWKSGFQCRRQLLSEPVRLHRHASGREPRARHGALEALASSCSRAAHRSHLLLDTMLLIKGHRGYGGRSLKHLTTYAVLEDLLQLLLRLNLVLQKTRHSTRRTGDLFSVSHVRQRSVAGYSNVMSAKLHATVRQKFASPISTSDSLAMTCMF